MAVNLKVNKKENIVETIDFSNKDNYKTVKGLKGSFFEGEFKVLYKTQADKIVKAGFAEYAKAEFEVTESDKRTVKDIKTNN